MAQLERVGYACCNIVALLGKGGNQWRHRYSERGAIITVTDTTLVYEPKRRPKLHVRVARADITEVRLITHAYWFTPPWLEVVIHHRGGTLSIPHVRRRTAERLREALGFKPFGQ